MAIQKNNNTILTNLEMSIQISLSGLSFCILNSETKTIETLYSEVFQSKLNPYNLLDKVKHIFNSHEALQANFASITVVHVNDLATLVPKALFNEDNLADYLKYNSKILKTDYITHDTLDINDSVNVYVPFVNINNYIFDHFGSFTFKHFSTVLIEQLLQQEKNTSEEKVFINVSKFHFEILVIKNGKLVLYNTFQHNSKEDFIYYTLFTLEQLQLNPESVKTILLGDITLNDTYYDMLYTYIRDVSFLKPQRVIKITDINTQLHTHYTLLNSF